jgi:hypothetical protein
MMDSWTAGSDGYHCGMAVRPAAIFFSGSAAGIIQIWHINLMASAVGFRVSKWSAT